MKMHGPFLGPLIFFQLMKNDEKSFFSPIGQLSMDAVRIFLKKFVKFTKGPPLGIFFQFFQKTFQGGTLGKFYEISQK